MNYFEDWICSRIFVGLKPRSSTRIFAKGGVSADFPGEDQRQKHGTTRIAKNVGFYSN